MAGVSNYDRVTQCLKIVQGALGPFVHRELCGRFGGKWWTEGVLPVLSDVRSGELPATGNGKDLVEKLDVADLARIITRQWNLLAPKLHRDDRNYANELISIRNTWAHYGAGDMPEDDAWRALDTMTRLIEHVQPAAARETQALAKAVREASYKAPPAPAPAIQAPPHPLTSSPSRGEGEQAPPLSRAQGEGSGVRAASAPGAR